VKGGVMSKAVWGSVRRRDSVPSINRRRRRTVGRFETLESRHLLVATAAFDGGTGALVVSENLGAPIDNDIVVSFRVINNQPFVFVTDHGFKILPGAVAASRLKSITIATAGGNDRVNLSDVGSSQFPQLFQAPIVDGGIGNDTLLGSKLVDLMFGVDGNDTLIGLESGDYLFGGEGADRLFGDFGSNNAPGSGNDVLFGEAGDDLLFGDQGNDTLFGFAGVDQLFGGDDSDSLFGGNEDDQLIGQVGNDRIFGESGNDRMIWNPGDGTDRIEGDDGFDTVEVNGGNGREIFTVTANSNRVRFDRTSPAPFSLDIGTTENLLLNANGGDDTFTAGNGLSTLIAITVDGGTGDDTLSGGDGADVLLGGDGNDTVDGNRGNDVALLDAGDDVFVWDPGDGSDVIEGQAGQDALVFNGAAAAEFIEISANAGRARFFRDVGNITMDLNDVERIDFNALGGVDAITVRDLSGTDVSEVNVSLAAALGGNTGDGQLDAVIVSATAGDDVISLSGDNGAASVIGLAATVNISNAEVANDRLVVNALAGNDVIDGSNLSNDAIQFTGNGDEGDDIVTGGGGNDTLTGGDGDDVLIGGPGVDNLDGGTGNNTIIQD
jgi:Ca2+-binding RTX toxin-like protein